MTVLIVVSVVLIVLLIAGLAFFLAWLGTLLSAIAADLEECDARVQTIGEHAESIRPGLEHINHSGGVVAGALPLLYGYAERIAAPSNDSGPAASGRRRSRLTEAVGFRASGSG